jgi:hypothetical protein
LFVQRYSADASPFQWVATADSIQQKIAWIAKRIPRRDTSLKTSPSTGNSLNPVGLTLPAQNWALETPLR